MERNNSVSAPGLSRCEKQLAVHVYSNDNKFEPVTEQIVYSTSSSSDPMMTSLRLGRRKEYGTDHHNSSCFTGISTFTNPSIPAKRSRASYQNMLNPCCQVEGCNLDLKSAKDYHRRHRICESHSKSPRVIVAGMERRFCQQCSRFHDLSEFDDKKRSCRRRLLDHNVRRRRVQPESVQLLSAALYDQTQHNLLLNGFPVQLSNSTWEDANTCMLRQGLIRPSRTRVPEGAQCYSSDLDKFCPIRSSNHRVLDQCSQIQTASSPTAPYLPNAHSLLSSNSWSLNEGHYSMTSLDGGLVHGNYNNHHHYPQGISHQQEYQSHL